LRKRTTHRRATHVQRCEFSISFPSTQTKRRSRDEPLHSAESIPSTSLPFNDADEVSCRAGAIKYSRCRASFAPICPAVAGQKLVPP